MSEAQRLKSLEDEDRRLKHLVADLSLEKEVLKGDSKLPKNVMPRWLHRDHIYRGS